MQPMGQQEAPRTPKEAATETTVWYGNIVRGASSHEAVYDPFPYSTERPPTFQERQEHTVYQIVTHITDKHATTVMLIGRYTQLEVTVEDDRSPQPVILVDGPEWFDNEGNWEKHKAEATCALSGLAAALTEQGVKNPVPRVLERAAVAMSHYPATFGHINIP